MDKKYKNWVEIENDINSQLSDNINITRNNEGYWIWKGDIDFKIKIDTPNIESISLLFKMINKQLNRKT